MTVSGVYCIQNKINGKVYIGSTSRDFETRFKEHKRLLLENRHHCSYLQRAWNKYGEMAFEFHILDHVSGSIEILKADQAWIDSIRQFNGIYNTSILVGSPLSQENTDEASARISEIQKKKWENQNRRDALAERNRNRTDEERRVLHDIGRQRIGSPDVTVISPDGQKFREIIGVRKFCKEHGLDYRSFLRLSKGEYATYKGWTVEGRQCSSSKRSDSLRKYYNEGDRVKYNLKSPSGELFLDIQNLSEFCKNHGLEVGNVRKLFRRKSKSALGWIAVDDNGNNINIDFRRKK